MIEVSLYSVPVGSDVNASMGKCVDRTRFDKDALGTGVMEFVKGFLRTNVPNFEPALQNPDIVGFINPLNVVGILYLFTTFIKR